MKKQRWLDEGRSAGYAADCDSFNSAVTGHMFDYYASYVVATV